MTRIIAVSVTAMQNVGVVLVPDRVKSAMACLSVIGVKLPQGGSINAAALFAMIVVGPVM